MKAAVLREVKKPLVIEDVQINKPGPHEVLIRTVAAGVCHSDLHQVRNEWSGVMPTVYPCVPGHEIVGRVTKVGSAVKGFKPGDLAAVGCMVDTDRTCPECQAGLEQFCPNMTLTYNFPDKHLGGVTYGGYSDSVVVDERFVLHVPANLDLAGTAPLDGFHKYVFHIVSAGIHVPSGVAMPVSIVSAQKSGSDRWHVYGKTKMDLFPNHHLVIPAGTEVVGEASLNSAAWTIHWDELNVRGVHTAIVATNQETQGSLAGRSMVVTVR